MAGGGRGGFSLQAIRGFVNDLPKALDARRNIRNWFNAMGMRAEGIAKSRAPVLSGFLRGSISWALVGSNLAQGGVLQGRLRVGAVYGRRQEWEHRSRAFYAYYSVLDIAREMESTLANDTGVASVWIGTGRGWKGTMSFNPGISQGPTFGSHSRSFDEGVAGGGVAGSGRVGGSI